MYRVLHSLFNKVLGLSDGMQFDDADTRFYKTTMCCFHCLAPRNLSKFRVQTHCLATKLNCHEMLWPLAVPVLSDMSETLNPNPETLNPKPSTLSPKP